MSTTLQSPRRGLEISARQRVYYFAIWRSVVDEMGWLPAEAEEKRRLITLEVTGQESIKFLTNRQFTRLIEHLKLLANPLSIQAALPVANPKKSAEDDERRQLVYKLNQYGYTTFYIAKVAEPICRQHGCLRWTDLPIQALRNLRNTIAARAHARSKKETIHPF